MFYVYEHWRLDKDECFYVGKGSAGRAYSRNRRNSHWKNIVAKLERLGFAYEVRIVASNLTEEEAFNLERERILFWRDIVDLTNLTNGGEGPVGYTHSVEAKNKISAASASRVLPPDFGARVSKGKTGKPSPMKGTKFSDEHKQKLSIAHKGKKMSFEARAKMSASKKALSAAKKELT